jgi:hypothetical protein
MVGSCTQAGRQTQQLSSLRVMTALKRDTQRLALRVYYQDLDMTKNGEGPHTGGDVTSYMPPSRALKWVKDVATRPPSADA